MKLSLPGFAPQLVAIVGPSGAGKSWLASQLQARLGKEAALLRLDDFYRDRSDLPLASRRFINFDHPRSIDWAAFEQVLFQYKAGRPIQTPRYDFKQHIRQERSTWRRPKPLVLVEGLWLLRRASIRRLFALRIYVECPHTLQLRRRLRRDAVERGRSPQSVREQFAEQVLPMAKRHVLPQARWADAVVKSPVSARRIDRLAEQIRQLLENRPLRTGPLADHSGAELRRQGSETVALYD